MDPAFFNLILPTVLRGTANTIVLSLAVLIISSVAGFGLALTFSFGGKYGRLTVRLMSSIFRGVPPLILLLAVFLGLPKAGVTLTPFVAAVAGMSLYISFFFSEAFVSGIQSIKRDQFQAAEALGLPFGRVLYRIIIPQMLPAALPSYFSRATEIIKGTAISAVVAYPELATLSKQIIAATFRPIETLSIIVVVYIILNGMLLGMQSWAERRNIWA